jgi:hypothetical protein
MILQNWSKGFEVFNDFLGENVGLPKIVRFFEAFVSEDTCGSFFSKPVHYSSHSWSAAFGLLGASRSLLFLGLGSSSNSETRRAQNLSASS